MTLLTMLQRKKHQMKMHQVRRKAPQAAFHHENVVLLQKPRGERERTESVMTVAVADVAVIAVVATTTATVVIMIAIATTIAVTTAVTTTNTAATTIAIIAAITAAAVTRDLRAVTELLSALVSEVT